MFCWPSAEADRTDDFVAKRLVDCRADVRFVRPKIQVYEAHVVDLYQWVCARYLAGVKDVDTKAKRDLSSALDGISERIMLASTPKSAPETNYRKEKTIPTFQ